MSASAPQPNWRLNDGSTTFAPSGVRVDDAVTEVLPGTVGSPALPSRIAIAAGEVVSLTMEASIIEREEDGGASGQAGVILSILPTASSNQNHEAVFRQIIIIGSQSEKIRAAFRANATFDEGGLFIVPTLSYFGRAVRLTGIRWEVHGTDAEPDALTAPATSYAGHEPDAPWREEARAKIRQHRMADLRFSVVDRWGEAVAGARIEVEQTRHAYSFGTAVIGSRIADAPREWSPESGMTSGKWLEDNARYRRALLENFNTVVFENELKWPQWAGAAPGVHRQEWTFDAINWLDRHDITMKGHTLVWGSWRFTPEWLRERENDPEAIHRAALAHIRDLGNATSDRTTYWDVLNEPMSHRDVIELLGMERVAGWFQEARRALPGNRLVMNEFDLVGNGGNARRRADFIEFYRSLVKHGAPIDVIGFQGHFWSDRFTPPTDIWAIIGEVHEATGLPLMISEFDSNFPNERMQADYTRDFLTAWFAHPATEAFIMWGFWGGGHWMGDTGAMIRGDWTEKPNLTAWRDLVYGEWWTRDTATTDASGRATVRAFKGDHRVTVTGPTGESLHPRHYKLAGDGRDITVVLH